MPKCPRCESRYARDDDFAIHMQRHEELDLIAKGRQASSLEGGKCIHGVALGTPCDKCKAMLHLDRNDP